jgi:N-methylhydantoinase B/oxoprolinase/acetone carboxylase alpha subunit
VTNALFGALGALSSAQGSMNNLTFGNDKYQYYETICSGAPAGVMNDGAGFSGTDAVHTHMTNSRLTDPEVLEMRFPVLLEDFHIRRRRSEGPPRARVTPGPDRTPREGLTQASQHPPLSRPSASAEGHPLPPEAGPARLRIPEAQAGQTRPERETRSGGRGTFSAGNGTIRTIRFLERMDCAILSSHRTIPPHGLLGGEPGELGATWVRRADGRIEELEGADQTILEGGDAVIVRTPTGGGYGPPE